MKILLASQSPRRQALLEQIGIEFERVDAEIDERIAAHESPEDAVTRLAREKALAGRAVRADLPLLAADTIVVIGKDILGKPVDFSDAERMLTRLSAKEHQVLTAVSLIDQQGELHSVLSTSTVRFRQIETQEIRDYWATGEPQDKAGSYAIQGLGAVFVEHISGSCSGIMGLPLFETAQLLKHINAHSRYRASK